MYYMLYILLLFSMRFSKSFWCCLLNVPDMEGFKLLHVNFGLQVAQAIPVM